MERIAQIMFVLAVLVACVSQGQAQERVFSEYQYDEVGNIISRVQDVSGAVPSIGNVSPNIVRRNQTLTITLTGTGLRGARLGEQDSAFSFSNVTSSDEELSFTLTVDELADEGPTQVSVSTGLGTAFFSVNVLAELPDLRLSPIPLTLTPGTVLELNLSLSLADVLDHSAVISIDDTSIATVSTAQVDFLQGSITANQGVSISALSNGNTSLKFESESLGTQIFNLRVTDDEFSLTPGNTESFYSPAVGLNKLTPPLDLVERTSMFAQLSINKLSPAVDTDNQVSAFANPVGLLSGSYYFPPEPSAVGAGSSVQRVVINGRGLANVVSVEVSPSDNIVVDDLTVNTNGESLSFALSVNAGTPLALRQLILRDDNGIVEPASLRADRLYIGGGSPSIESLSPIFLNRGDVRTITVQGADFDTVRGVRFDNQDNLSISSPRPSADGRSLTFNIEVFGFARIGPRALTLESLLGDSIAQNDAANIINIEDAPPRVISPVVSPVVGISKLASQAPPTSQTVARANAVGVTRGGILSAITPSSRSQGSSVTLEISGEGLTRVASAGFEPADGITVNEFTANLDGTSATLSIDISDDAAPVVRRLQLFTDTARLPAIVGADQFAVTLPQPQIDSVSPVILDRGQAIVPITIRGELLNDASRLTVIPSDGIIASTPVASLDGRSVELSLTLAADAPLTPRVLQLTTPGGLTESVFMPSNTVQIVDGISRVITPILALPVGVVRISAFTPPVLRDLSAVSNGVGIIKQVAVPPALPTQFAYANSVGVTKGPVIFEVAPLNLSINTSDQAIEVRGNNLDNVTTVRTIPAEGVTLTGPAVISNDGSRVSFTASVDNDAPQTSRRLELLTADGSVPYAVQTTSQIRVTGLQAELESIEPIQQVRGASFTMIIRGINLSTVQSVEANPSNGIQFDTPVAAADGRSLTVPVFIASTASTEQIVIRVTTDAGTTTSAAMPANTFTIISE